MNIRERLLAFGENGNEANIKELRTRKRHYCLS